MRIKDVARVELSQQTYSSFAEVNGHKAAEILIFPLPGANALTVADEIQGHGGNEQGLPTGPDLQDPL